MTKPESVDAYIEVYPTEVQAILNHLRNLVRDKAPDAIEGMAYGMPGYKLNGKPLVYFAAYAKHIGLYATPVGHAAFEDELAGYKQGKGSVQFPLNKPMPYDLIERMIQHRITDLSIETNTK